MHYLLVFLFSSLIFNSLFSQKNTTAAGGDHTGAGGSVAFSIGQIDYTAHSSSNGNIQLGVQHAYEIFTAGTPDIDLTFDIHVFPNPMVDQVNIRMGGIPFDDLSFQLYDDQGRLIREDLIIQELTAVDMALYPPAIYFLSIYQSEKMVQNFKIIKTDN